VVTVVEIGFAAGLDAADIRVHDHVGCAGFLEDMGAAGAVVVVGVADEEDLNLAPVEA
jgi:hypothetical protein